MSGEYIGKIVECGDRKYMVVEEVLTLEGPRLVLGEKERIITTPKEVRLLDEEEQLLAKAERMCERYTELVETSDEVREFCDLDEELYGMGSKKQPDELYREENGCRYYIELPYWDVIKTWEMAEVRHYGYSWRMQPTKGGSFRGCLALCGYTHEEIELILDKQIEKDRRLETAQ